MDILWVLVSSASHQKGSRMKSKPNLQTQIISERYTNSTYVDNRQDPFRGLLPQNYFNVSS
jgi:hypothetical protein